MRLAPDMGSPSRLRLVSFDLDGTLIDGTAFLLVARHLGFEEEVLRHDARYRSGEISLEECFRVEFRLLKGKRLEQIETALENGTWFPGIQQAVRMLQAAGLQTLVLTDNPDFIARHVERFGIEEVLCSQGEVDGGVITGEVRPRFDKWAGLKRHLHAKGIDPAQVVHVGNDLNDVAVWRHVGLSVCVEPTSPAVAQAADIVIETIDDHRSIAQAILDHDRTAHTQTP